MTIEEIYNYADRIGLHTFSTIYNGEVHSRIAHFNGYDSQGIYLRTMGTKPYGRQLRETLQVTVCGHSDAPLLNHDDIGAVPDFAPGYTFRLIGELRYVSPEEIAQNAKTNKMLEVAARDIISYPAMAEGNFQIIRARGEIYDYDFAKVNRPYKLHRRRFAFGGMTYNEAGVSISEQCIECGRCYEICSFSAIEEGSPYRVLSERCDDCGSCMLECPVGAIKESKVI